MIVLAVIGILGIIGGILYVSGAANSIHFIDGSVYHGHHQVRAVVSFVVGIAFLIMAYIAKTRPARASGANVTGTAGGSNVTGTAGGSNVTGAAGAAGPAAGPATGPGSTGGSERPTTPSGS